jgi:uncharacterized membrane protein YcaP (DUF421 family)
MGLMDIIANIDWHTMWVPGEPLLEVVIRGTVMYVGLVLLFRVLRRETGSLSLADLLLVVLISDAAQNGMAGEYRSITAGLVLVTTIAGWSYLFDWLSYHNKTIERLLQPAALPLIRNGVMLHRNMRRQFITSEELKSQLRQQGVARIEEVKNCYLEPDGQISVIKRSAAGSKPSDTRPVETR